MRHPTAKFRIKAHQQLYTGVATPGTIGTNVCAASRDDIICGHNNGGAESLECAAVGPNTVGSWR